MVVQTQLAGRRRARSRAAGHRPDRAQAAGSAERRLGAQLLASPASRWCSSRSRIRRRRARCPTTFYQVRKKIGDIRNTLPAGIQGPFFNDEFGDTYTNIYAMTGDGFGYRELKEFGDRVRAELLRVPGVAKVDFIGEQDEKIFIELSNAKLATLGVEPAQIIADARRAERGRGGRRVRHGDRPHLRARRPARSTRRRDPRHRDPRQRPRVPPRRHRDGRRAATSIRRSRRCATRARRRSGIGVTMAQGGDVIELGHDLDARDRRASQQAAAGRRRARRRSRAAARGAALDQRVRALARRGGGHRARRVAS